MLSNQVGLQEMLFGKGSANVEIGRIERPERLITSHVSLEDSITKGFGALLTKGNKDLKILVSPGLATTHRSSE